MASAVVLLGPGSKAPLLPDLRKSAEDALLLGLRLLTLGVTDTKLALLLLLGWLLPLLGSGSRKLRSHFLLLPNWAAE
jgi:hypothetical protein